MIIARLDSSGADFDARLDALLAFENTQDSTIDATVATILEDVRRRGDVAVLEYTRRFDRLDAPSMQALEIPGAELRAALDGLGASQRDALEQAAQRIRAYHQSPARSDAALD